MHKINFLEQPCIACVYSCCNISWLLTIIIIKKCISNGADLQRSVSTQNELLHVVYIVAIVAHLRNAVRKRFVYIHAHMCLGKFLRCTRSAVLFIPIFTCRTGIMIYNQWMIDYDIHFSNISPKMWTRPKQLFRSLQLYIDNVRMHCQVNYKHCPLENLWND